MTLTGQAGFSFLSSSCYSNVIFHVSRKDVKRMPSKCLRRSSICPSTVISWTAPQLIDEFPTNKAPRITAFPDQAANELLLSSAADDDLNQYSQNHFQYSLCNEERFIAASKQFLSEETDTFSEGITFDTDNRFCEKHDFLKMKTIETIGREYNLKNGGAKKSIGNQSFIVGPPSCDDVLDELEIMENSLRK
jgi:hypothetical protein